MSFALNLESLQIEEYDGVREGADAFKESYDPALWLTGTSDYEDDERTDDLKTGSWPVRAQDNPQLKSYVLPRWIKLGQPIDWRRRLTITQWPKYPISALPTVDEGWVTGLDMAMHLEALQWARTHTNEFNITDEGCKFCPGKTTYQDLACEEAYR